jgi:hypothetical protein
MKHSEFSNIVSKASKETGRALPCDIERSNYYFHWHHSPGIFMIDVDDATLSYHEFFNKLATILPVLENAPRLYKASTSSNIYNGDTIIRGEVGYRFLVGVSDATKTPMLGKLLTEHLWLHDMGEIKISSAGTMLERTLIDGCVWQPSRVDFAAGAVCVAPLNQAPSEVKASNVDNAPLDIDAAIEYLTLSSQQLKEIQTKKKQAKQVSKPQATLIREKWLNERATELTSNNTNITHDEAKEMFRIAVDTKCLPNEFEIVLSTGETVTVGELLSDAEKYDSSRCADPIVGPTYHNDPRIAYISLQPNKQPYIFSHAHGGMRYILSPQKATIVVARGNSRKVTNETLDSLVKQGNYFKMGCSLVKLCDDNLIIHFNKSNSQLLAYHLAENLRYIQYDTKGTASPKDLAEQQLSQILQVAASSSELREIKAVADMPFLRLDGSVCDQAGYDKKTQVFLTLETNLPAPVPITPTMEMVMESLRCIWKPFKDFPFTTSVSRGVYLAALLTTVCRKSLPTAPAFATDAPKAGTGKSLLSSAIGQLLQGYEPTITTDVHDDEMRKRITSYLIEGQNVMIVDNITEAFSSKTLEAFLTASEFGDRVLGSSRTVSYPNRMMTIFNGNNISFAGDLNRRVLRTRLDANTENPHERQFELDVLEYVKEHRLDMVLALLTLIRGYLTLGQEYRPKTGMASFNDWSRLVRGTVCWLAEIQNEIALEDPNLSIAENYQNDDQRQTVSEVFTSWHALFGSTGKLAKEVFEHINQPINYILQDESDAHAETLKTNLLALLERQGKNELNAKTLSRVLERHKDSVINGFKLTVANNKSGGSNLWQVQPV